MDCNTSHVETKDYLYNHYVCRSYDDYLEDKDSAVYIATLSDGTVVYQDDDRPDVNPIAWVRLKNYCEQNNLYVSEMRLKFRSHTEFSCKCSDGIFFRKKVTRGVSEGSVNSFHYIIGNVINREIYTKHWKIPELIMDEEDIRDLNSEESVNNRYEEFIIWKREQ